MDQHAHWGPSYVPTPDGDVCLKIGAWRFDLGGRGRKDAQGDDAGERLAALLAARGDPSVRIRQMDELGQDVQVVSLPSHYAMY